MKLGNPEAKFVLSHTLLQGILLKDLFMRI